jgi:glycyl-tRNA synthetase beta chain
MALKNLPAIKDFGETKVNILQFFETRLETVFSDQGYSPDLIQSILPLSLHVQLNDIKERFDAVQKFKDDKMYNDFLTAMKRVNNIIPKTALPELKTELMVEEPEKKLKEKLDSIKSGLTVLFKDRKYHDAISLISSLTDTVNQFFDRVLVMDKREEIRQNRLALLNDIWRTASTIADFSKLSARQEP